MPHLVMPDEINLVIYYFGIGLVLLFTTVCFAFLVGLVQDLMLSRIRNKHREYVHLKGVYMDFNSWQQYGKPVEMKDPKTGQMVWALTEKPADYTEEWATKMLLRSNGFMADMLLDLDRKYNAVREAENNRR